MTKVQAMVATMIKPLRKILFLFIVWAFTFHHVNAQTTDFRSRAGVKIQKDISKKLTVSIEYEHRFNNFLTTFDKALVEPSLSYDLFNFMRVGAEWRFMASQNSRREIEYNQRGALYVRVQQSIDDFDVKLRTALQYGFDELTLSASVGQKLISRNTVEVEYNWFGSKFKPFVSCEFFYHINHPNGGIINQWRAKTGTSYRLSKKSEFSIYYLFENEINVAYPVDAHVIGIGFSHKL